MNAPLASAVTPARHGLHVVVPVGDEAFAFPVSHVEEAIDAPSVEWVPVAPAGMLGQMAHRGRMVGAWDARWAFRLVGPAAAGAALVLRDGPRRVALVVDDVMEMTRMDPAEVRAVPAGADRDGVLSGVWVDAQGGRALVNIVRVEALAALVSQHGTFGEGMAR